MNPSLTPAERDALLARPHTAVVTFELAPGRTMGVPVWVTWTGEVFRFQSGPEARKSVSFRRTGRASVCVHEDTSSSVMYLSAEGPVVEVAFEHERDILEPAVWRLGEERGSAFAAAFAGRDPSLFSAWELTPETWWSRDYAKLPVAPLLLDLD